MGCLIWDSSITMNHLTEGARPKAPTQQHLCVGGVCLIHEGHAEQLNDPVLQGQERDGLILGGGGCGGWKDVWKQTHAHIHARTHTQRCIYGF